MNNHQILDQLVTLINKHFQVNSEINPETTLKNDLGLDSIKLMELINFIENEFNISIDDEDFENPIVDISGLIHLISSKIN